MSPSIRRLIPLEDSQRILSREMCEALTKRILSFTSGGGETQVNCQSFWSGELRWGRNRVALASDRRDISISVERTLRNRVPGTITTNQVDGASLAAAVRVAEQGSLGVRPDPDFVAPPPPSAFQVSRPAIWSDATYAFGADARAELARALLEPAEAAGLVTAGYLELRAESSALHIDEQPFQYARRTLAQCSITARDQRGTGSGWAGLSSYDWGKIDAAALAKRALEKCIESRNPVGLEPGRYTVILEPQAVHDLVDIIVRRGGPLDRFVTEEGSGPFTAAFDSALQLWRSKLGLKVVDERITISHDPADSLLGVIPFDGYGEPYRPITWIADGVLTNLPYNRRYALTALNDNQGFPNSGSYRMSGGSTSMEEMIRTTKRGLLVTRFSNISVLDLNNLLSTGLTRDGLWLIENGKLTKPVKNFRFTESPLFVLNSIEQLGEPVPVYSPGVPAVVPPLKARDFSFTSLVDAV